jgi:hypothetical protein
VIEAREKFLVHLLAGCGEFNGDESAIFLAIAAFAPAAPLPSSPYIRPLARVVFCAAFVETRCIASLLLQEVYSFSTDRSSLSFMAIGTRQMLDMTAIGMRAIGNRA